MLFILLCSLQGILEVLPSLFIVVMSFSNHFFEIPGKIEQTVTLSSHRGKAGSDFDVHCQWFLAYVLKSTRQKRVSTLIKGTEEAEDWSRGSNCCYFLSCGDTTDWCLMQKTFGAPGEINTLFPWVSKAKLPGEQKREIKPSHLPL